MTPKQFADRFMEQALRELRKLSWISRREQRGSGAARKMYPQYNQLGPALGEAPLNRAPGGRAESVADGANPGAAKSR
jgi:hypothetical protein